MLTEIENYLFEGDIAHDIYEIKKNKNQWVITIASTVNPNTMKIFIFKNVEEKYEELLEKEEILEYPLPIIGFESIKKNGTWEFILNANSVEWGFKSEWPIKA